METQVDKQIKTRIYQAQMLHKEFAQRLNVVIIHKTNLKTGACAHVILFSSDLELSYDKIIDYLLSPFPNRDSLYANDKNVCFHRWGWLG